MKREDKKNKIKSKRLDQKVRTKENRDVKGFKYIGEGKLAQYINGGFDISIYRCLNCNSIVWTSEKGNPTCTCKFKKEKLIRKNIICAFIFLVILSLFCLYLILR
jgi:hypothetical protein